MVKLSPPDIDKIPLSFGKHKGSTPSELLEQDSHYLVWLYKNIDPPPLSKDLYMLACDQDDGTDYNEKTGHWDAHHGVWM